MQEINDFWLWFQRRVLPSLLQDEIPASPVVDELDERVGTLGLSWELGPSPDGSEDWAFAVSFSADLRRMTRAEAVVTASPEMRRCQVLLGKPPKNWDGIVEFSVRGRSLRFSTADWRCKVVPMAGGVAIVVTHDVLDEQIDEDGIAAAAAIAVQSELGEERFARRVRDLSLVDDHYLRALPGPTCLMRDLRACDLAEGLRLV